MKPEEFAARRRADLAVADERLGAIVARALQSRTGAWYAPIVDEAGRIWLEHFQAEAPGSNFLPALGRFRAALADSLEKTSDPTSSDRVTRFVSTFSVNAGTINGAAQRGITHKRWTTMHDGEVRDLHAPMDGQIRPIGGLFDLGIAKLPYPGVPSGPPEAWIECRCVAQPASREGETMSSTTFALGPDDQIEDDNPDVVLGEKIVAAAFADQSDLTEAPTEVPLDDIDEDEDDDEDITEIPVHGVLAPEGVLTGDGRGFREGALSTRPLPVPLRLEIVGTHGGNTSDVVTVGRVDEAWRDEERKQMRFRGAIIVSKEHAARAIESIIDGSGTGVSIDADDMAVDIEAFEADSEAAMKEGRTPPTWFKEARVAGLTIVPIPAFHEAYIALGHEFEEDMTDEDREAAREALAACGCADVTDVSADADENARAAAEAEDGAYRQYDADARKRMAKNGQALPDGSFPIADEEDLKNAIQAIGRASDPEAARAHIKKRAKALGKEALIPEDWSLGSEVFDYAGLEPGDRAYFGTDLAYAPADVKARIEAWEARTFAPGTKDGPGWITNPVATARIRRYWVRGEGAAKIRWGMPGDFNRCRRQLVKYVQNPDWLAGLCANMHKEALGFWPGEHRGNRGRHALIASGAAVAPVMTLVQPDEEKVVFPDEWFEDPKFSKLTPMTIDKETGRIYGHLAQWGVCHIGIAGACVDPPRSRSNYAAFLRGVVDTTKGERRVGCLTYGTGHARPELRLSAATAHYDQTDAVFAFVNIGEDRFGIWYSGVIRPLTPERTIDDVRAIGALSGDWRYITRHGLELVGAVTVNGPGYPVIAASGGVQTTLILGNVEPEVSQAGTEGFSDENEEWVARIAARTLRMVKDEERKSAARSRLVALRNEEARRALRERI